MTSKTSDSSLSSKKGRVSLSSCLQSPRFFIFAGELSGDLHGGFLAEALRLDFPNCQLLGVSGPLMRKAGVKQMLPTEAFQVMGFSDVMLALPRLTKLFYQTRHAILKEQPDAVILIDYPGFNLRLAKSLRRLGYVGKIIQFIAPTIWAHGKKRLQSLEAHFDLVLTIFPFEASLFETSKVQAQYIGNPLISLIHQHSYDKRWRDKRPFLADRPLIALFPGSREGEINRHLDSQLKLARQLHERCPTSCFALCVSHEQFERKILEKISHSGLQLNRDIFLTKAHERYDLMSQADTAIAKSGTVTLELAIHETPTLVHYAVSPLNYLLAKYLLKLSLPHYCIVNILANQAVFPEFIGKNLSHEELKQALLALHTDLSWRERIKKSCRWIKESLTPNDPSREASKAIDQLLQGQET